MTNLNRLPIKWVRDYIKKDYKAKDACYICGDTSNLDLHHIYSLSELFHNWCEEKKIQEITSNEEILHLRTIFAVDCAEKLSNDNLYTLCGTHHKRLHSIYGQRYANTLAPKIIKWLNIQKDKHG